MQKTEKIIRQVTDLPFGVCGFETVADKLFECRAKERLPKDPKSIICFVFPYKVEEAPPENISRYAAVPDYHKVCGGLLETISKKLKSEYPDFEFCAFVDNSPIPEVRAAACAGLGVIGKNGLLITENYGSFVFIGEIVTDMPFETAKNMPQNCINCGACEKACPVMLQKGKCLSALTQKKQPLADDEQQLIIKSGCIWGCDICQNVCPYNSKAQKSAIEAFYDGYRSRYEKGESISGRAFEWRGERVIKRNAELLEQVADVVAADTAADDRK